MKLKIKIPQFTTRGFSLKEQINRSVLWLSSSSLAAFVAVAVFLLGLNVFSQNYFWRVDLTEAKSYSLSSGTKNILKNLDEDVTITVYFSENLPPELMTVKRNVLDLLGEYERYSNEKLNIKTPNPNNDTFKDEALASGIREVQFSELSQDKFEIATGFVGLVVTSGEDSEPIEIITGVESFEYDLTSRIRKLTVSDQRKIGFLTGHEEKILDVNLKNLKEILEREYLTESVSLSEGKPVDPEEIDLLIVAGPTGKFSQRDLFELDQYVLRGGKLMLLADTHVFSTESTALEQSALNINELLSAYGVQLTGEIVQDESFLPVNGSIAYPYWVLALEENINNKVPTLTNVESAAFFWASTVKEIDGESETEYTSLVSTTENAWVATGENIPVNFGDIKLSNSQDQYDISALVEGKFTSKFKGKDMPKLDNTEAKDLRSKDLQVLAEGEGGKVVIVGDADFIGDDFLNESTEENATFLLNMVDWLNNSNDLSQIRAKSLTSKPLAAVEDWQKTMYKAVATSVVPVLLIVGGFAYNYFRRNRKSRF